MRHLHNQSFNVQTLNIGRRKASVFISRTLKHDASSHLSLLAKEVLSSPADSRQFQIIEHNDDETFFLKSSKLRHWKHRLRSTFGIKRAGHYHSPIAEIHNHIALLEHDYIPRIQGYGVIQSPLGITERTLIITDYKKETLNLKEHLSLHPEKLESTLQTAFTLIKNHLQDDLIHLDLWMGNILIDTNTNQPWMIDVEVFKKTRKEGLTAEKLVFCLGYLFRLELSAFISFEQYLALVEQWVSLSWKELKISEIYPTLHWAAHTIISRKQRLRKFQ